MNRCWKGCLVVKLMVAAAPESVHRIDLWHLEVVCHAHWTVSLHMTEVDASCHAHRGLAPYSREASGHAHLILSPHMREGEASCHAHWI